MTDNCQLFVIVLCNLFFVSTLLKKTDYSNYPVSHRKRCKFYVFRSRVLSVGFFSICNKTFILFEELISLKMGQWFCHKDKGKGVTAVLWHVRGFSDA